MRGSGMSPTALLRKLPAAIRVRDTLVRRLRRWLEEVEELSAEIPFDNRSDWIGMTLERFMQDPLCRAKAPYIWGVLQGCALGKVLGLSRVSVMEFGVASGAGLLSLERIAERAEKSIGIEIEVYGFDTGFGLPKPQDYRDCPNLWLDGQFPMDVEALSARLRRTSLRLGLIKETVPAFLQGGHAPVAFAAIDVDLYSSTKEVFQLFQGSYDRLLPRVVCYFDDIMGWTFNEYNGERLAIAEFNVEHAMRKICPLHGLKYFVPTRHRNRAWPELMFLFHMFDHPLYDQHDVLRKPMLLDINGNLADWRRTLNIPRHTAPGLSFSQ